MKSSPPPPPLRQTVNIGKIEGGKDPSGKQTRGNGKSNDNTISPGSGDKPKYDVTLLDHKRIIRNENKLHVAFTPQHDDGKAIRVAIIRAGEEKRNESEVPIITANVTSPLNFDVQKDGNHIVMASKQNKRIVLELEIPKNEAYTGYEIVEIFQNSKSMESKK